MFESYLSETGTVVYPTDETDTLPYVLYGRACAVVYQNELHLLGGTNSDNPVASSASKMHYAWNGYGWRSVSTLPMFFLEGRAVVYDGKIHLIGGYHRETANLHYVWDGVSWEQLDNIPCAVKTDTSYFSSGVFVYENKIHTIGIYNTFYSSSFFDPSHYSFDGNTWTQETDYVGDKDSLVFMYNGKIHCIGKTGYHYVYQNGDWVQLTDVSKTSSNMNTAYGIEFNGKYYFFRTSGGTSTGVFDGTEIIEPSWGVTPYGQTYYSPYASTPVVYQNKLHLMGGRVLYYNRMRAHMIFNDTNETFYECTNKTSRIYIKTRKNPT